jgi:DNA-binding response OmpR family regulator
MKILLLEPNRLLAQQYTAYLNSQGYEVAWRADAQAGIVAADRGRPDLVIVELLLAGHSGVEFLYEFRSYSEWVQIPAVVLSAVTITSSGILPETLKELGVETYLYKPDTTLEKLGLIIARLLPPEKPNEAA